MPKGNEKIIIKTKTYLRCTMTTCQNDQLFSRRVFDVVMIARRKLDVYHLTLCLVEGGGVWWVEGQVKSGKGRCQNTTRVVAAGDVGATCLQPSCPWFGAGKAIMWVSATNVRRPGSCNLLTGHLKTYVTSEQGVLSVFHMLATVNGEIILPFCKILDHVACEDCMPSWENGLPKPLFLLYQNLF